jgi:protein TonB
MKRNILIIVSLLLIASQQIRSINFEEAKENSEETFMVVEEMPEFEGGQDSLITFIIKNTSYPIEAIEKK